MVSYSRNGRKDEGEENHMFDNLVKLKHFNGRKGNK